MSTYDIIVDFIHILAAVGWSGALFFSLLILIKGRQSESVTSLQDTVSLNRILGLVEMFSALFIILSGFLNIDGGLTNWGNLASLYQRFLEIKITLSVILGALGMFVGIYVGPKLRAHLNNLKESGATEINDDVRLMYRRLIIFRVIGCVLVLVLLFLGSSLLNGPVF